jgi:hypothetical protein
MNRPAAIALTLLLASTAAAAQQYIPSEEEKVAALKRAYELTEPRAVKTDRIMPTVDPNEVNAIDRQATPRPAPRPVKLAQATDICAHHHMHKVIRGSSWRCKR